MEKNDIVKRRVQARRSIILSTLDSLYRATKEPVATSDLYAVCLAKGYYYEMITFQVDLSNLTNDGLIEKDTQYMGNGKGTKSYYKIK